MMIKQSVCRNMVNNFISPSATPVVVQLCTTQTGYVIRKIDGPYHNERAAILIRNFRCRVGVVSDKGMILVQNYFRLSSILLTVTWIEMLPYQWRIITYYESSTIISLRNAGPSYPSRYWRYSNRLFLPSNTFFHTSKTDATGRLHYR